MAQFTISMPDDAQAMLVQSFCNNFGYQATLADGSPNPQTPEAFAQQKIIDYCRSVVVEYQSNVAAAAARLAVASQVAAIPVTITTGA